MSSQLVLTNQQIAEQLDVSLEIVNAIADCFGIPVISDEHLRHIEGVVSIILGDGPSEVPEACQVYVERYNQVQRIEHQVEVQESQFSPGNEVEEFSTHLYARFKTDVLRSFMRKLEHGVDPSLMSEGDRQNLQDAEAAVAMTIKKLGSRFEQTTAEIIEGKRPSRLSLPSPTSQPKLLSLPGQ
ncbi:MAG: hypothetical protein AAFU78_22045 [Cyanobacteria bacterium J06633_2]